MQKRLLDKLVDKCTENIDEVKIAEITLAGHDNVCVCSHTICVILAVIALAINIGIGAYFAYSRWYLKKSTLLVLILVPVLHGIAFSGAALKQKSNELINGGKK